MEGRFAEMNRIPRSTAIAINVIAAKIILLKLRRTSLSAIFSFELITFLSFL